MILANIKKFATHLIWIIIPEDLSEINFLVYVALQITQVVDRL